MINNVNDFFRERKGFFNSLDIFKKTGVYKHFENIFGELVYTEDLSKFFIGLDVNGYFYDEIYYPMDIPQKRGSLIPKIFLRDKTVKPHSIWKEVAENGYAIIEDFNFNEVDKSIVLNDTYIPFGFNKEFDFHETILHPYYMTQMNYDNPEKHKDPEHLFRMTESVLKSLRSLEPNLSEYKLHTTDSVKYLYNSNIPEAHTGPYSFHFDYFPRLMYMFFTYFSKKNPIVGRELLVGKRHDLLEFSPEILDLSSIKDPKQYNPFEKIQDRSLVKYRTIQIKDNMVVLMNTVNPLFVHRVERLREDNEVILLTNYVWSKEI